MKSDKNKVELTVEFSNAKQLKKAFDHIIEKFNIGEVKGATSGGNYFTTKYLFTREFEPEQKEVVSGEPKTKNDLVNERIVSDTKEFQTYAGIPQVVAVNQEGEENVVYVPIKARAGYLDGYGDAGYIETLPSFSMPHLTNGTYRCFEVQGNSMVRTFFDGDLVFGKYVEDLSDVKDGRVYIIVSRNDGIVLKRVINRIEERGKLILKPDNKDGNYPTYTINAEEIMEIWYVSMFASKQMPETVDVYDRLHDLESKIVLLENALQRKN